MNRVNDNPYVGLFPFGANDENRFFGRGKETRQLLTMIQDKQLTLLFGSSGTGKTSLIHAKLLPELARLYYHPIYLRINFASEDPLEATRRHMIKELRSWEPDLPDFNPGQTLTEYAALVSVFKGLIKPVLFFDQFEELFSLGYQNKREIIEAFMIELGDLIEMRLPGELRTSSSLENLVRFKVVLSMRQDRVAFIEDYKVQIPSLLQNRFRLKRFLAGQALEAVVGMGNSQGRSCISTETAKKIILRIGKPTLMKDETDTDPAIRNIAVDPIVLSVYCYQLFELVKNGENQMIDDDLVERNTHTSLIRSYYEEKMEGADKIKVLIEEKLLNAAGIRVLVPLNELTVGTEITGEDIRETARRTGIIRLIGPSASPDVEIVHDQIAERIFECRKEREAAENEAKLNEAAIARSKEAEKEKALAYADRRKASKLRKYSVALIAGATGIALLAIVATYIYVKYNADLKQANENMTRLTNMLTNGDSKMEKLVKDYTDTSAALGKSRAEFSAELTANHRLTQDNQDLNNTGIHYREAIAELNRHNNSLILDSQQLQKSVAGYTLKIPLLQSQIQELNANISTKDRQIADLTEEKAQLNTTRQNLTVERDNYRRNDSLSKLENERLKTVNTNLSVVKDNCNTRIARLNDSINLQKDIISAKDSLLVLARKGP